MPGRRTLVRALPLLRPFRLGALAGPTLHRHPWTCVDAGQVAQAFPGQAIVPERFQELPEVPRVLIHLIGRHPVRPVDHEGWEKLHPAEVGGLFDGCQELPHGEPVVPIPLVCRFSTTRGNDAQRHLPS